MYVSPYSKNSNPKRLQGQAGASVGQGGAASDVNYQTADERTNQPSGQYTSGFGANNLVNNVSSSNNNLQGVSQAHGSTEYNNGQQNG